MSASTNWVPKVGEKVVYLAVVTAVKSPNDIYTIVGGSDTPPGSVHFYSSTSLRPDPVPLLRELVLGARYPSGDFENCPYCHRMASSHVHGRLQPPDPNCIIEKVRAAYPEAFEEEKR